MQKLNMTFYFLKISGNAMWKNVYAMEIQCEGVEKNRAAIYSEATTSTLLGKPILTKIKLKWKQSAELYIPWSKRWSLSTVDPVTETVIYFSIFVSTNTAAKESPNFTHRTQYFPNTMKSPHYRSPPNYIILAIKLLLKTFIFIFIYVLLFPLTNFITRR